jgi:hypothetical protein
MYLFVCLYVCKQIDLYIGVIHIVEYYARGSDYSSLLVVEPMLIKPIVSRYKSKHYIIVIHKTNSLIVVIRTNILH